MIKQKTFKNGIRLIVDERKSKITSLNIGVLCGSKHENPSEYGVAHFVEHLFFKSTNSKKTQDLLHNLDFLGARSNAFTTNEMTVYTIDALNENFNVCFELYFDMLFNGIYDKTEVDAERKVILEEIKYYEDQSISKLFDECDKIMFNNTPYAHPVIGEENIIKNISIDEIKNFKNRFYTPNNIIISVAGGIKFKEAVKLINNTFGAKFKQKLKPTELHLKEYKIKPSKNLLNINKKDKQVNLALCYKGACANSNELLIQKIYVEMMSGGLSSRMFNYLRELHGYCYSTRILRNVLGEVGCLEFYVGTSPENVKNCIDGIRFLINEAAKNGFSEEELRKAKNQLKTSLILKADPKKSVSRNIRDILFDGRVRSINERVKKIESVTLDDVKKFAQKIARQKNVLVAAIGPNIDDKLLKI